MKQRNIKFRYVLRNKYTGYINKKIYTLNQIQKSGLSGLFDIENYDIISIEQFTELKDKNGKEIYESDILHNKGVNYVVGKLSVFGCVIRGKSALCNDLVLSNIKQIEECEIIGNIHENPNFLK